MRRLGVCLGVCLLILTMVGMACTAEELAGGSHELFPTRTATTEPGRQVDADEGVNTPTAPAEPPTAEQDAETVLGQGTPEQRQLPVQVPFPGETMITGEVPEELLGAIVDDLMERVNAARGAVEVQRAEAVVWRDGSLGCPQPGMMYTQALVNGYRVVLSYDGKTYDYHASENGYFFLCEGKLFPGAGPIDGGTGEAPNQ
jgi:hypothetical protein